MNSKLWVVIPTYWGNAESGIYDHPTPLDGKSTLPRLFETLIRQDYKDEFIVLVLISTTDDDYNSEATSRFEEIIENYSSKLDMLAANFRASRKLDGFLQQYGLNLEFRDMRGYGAVRNLQLLIPAALGAEIIVALDDDEVVQSDYLTQSVKHIGREVNGEKVVGLAGPYLDDSGSPYLQEPSEETNLLLDKVILMNEAMREIFSAKSVIKSNIAFGGNMVFHRDLFSRVGFDPGITRGEDMDYLINARINGLPIFFDPDLTIIHRPPHHFEAPEYAKLRQDVIRFEYERVKVTHFGMSPKEFAPYPGRLLSDDFPQIALRALNLTVTPGLAEQYGKPDEILEYSCQEAQHKLAAYLRFALNWPKAIEKLLENSFPDLRDELIPGGC